jgi:hypothetical protein
LFDLRKSPGLTFTSGQWQVDCLDRKQMQIKEK